MYAGPPIKTPPPKQQNYKNVYINVYKDGIKYSSFYYKIKISMRLNKNHRNHKPELEEIIYNQNLQNKKHSDKRKHKLKKSGGKIIEMTLNYIKLYIRTEEIRKQSL